MRKVVFILGVLLLSGLSHGVFPTWAYDYGDYRSETLMTKAWKALEEGDIEAVLAYTNKCIELYADQAKKMQGTLTAYPVGNNQEIFGYWALNDVATAFFIQAEAYRKANMEDEAKQAYQQVINDYSYGQCWDTRGWFWKPAEAAKEKIALIESGSQVDFGDYSSQALTTKAWEALGKEDLDAVVIYCDKALELYEEKAKEMQDSLTEYPWESKEKIFSYWALNDVGTCLYIKGEAYLKADEKDQAKSALKKLTDGYFYAQCWDPHGWFWKPAEAAQQKLEEL